MGALHRIDGGKPGELAAVRDERHGVHARDVRVVLRHVADAGANLERRLRHVEAEHRHLALVGLDEPEQALDHRALAGAVRPEQPDGARLERRGHVTKGEIAAVSHADVRQPHHDAAAEADESGAGVR